MLIFYNLAFVLTAQVNDIGNSGQENELSSRDINKYKAIQKSNRSFLMSAFDYSSNTNTLGTFNQFVRQPSYAISFSYFSKYNFDIGLSGLLTANSDDSLQLSTTELDFYAGYSFYLFDRKLTIYPSFTHFLFSSNTGSLKSLFSDNIQLGVMYMNDKLTFGNFTNYLTGSDKTFTTTFYFALNFVKENLFVKNASLSFQPEADLNFGNYEYLNNYYFDYFREHPLQMLTLREIVIVKRQNPDMTAKEIINYLIEQKTDDHFKATSFGLIFPLYYITGNFSVNLNGMIYFPIGLPDYLDSSVQFYFTAGISYEFAL